MFHRNVGLEHELYSCIFHLLGIFIAIDELIFERVRYTTNQYKIEDFLKMVDPQVTMNFNTEKGYIYIQFGLQGMNHKILHNLPPYLRLLNEAVAPDTVTSSLLWKFTILNGKTQYFYDPFQ